MSEPGWHTALLIVEHFQKCKESLITQEVFEAWLKKHDQEVAAEAVREVVRAQKPKEQIMSEYTPKTWEIKHAYVSHCENADWYERDIPEMAKEFDRWLAQHDADVAAKAKYELLMMQLENVRLEVEAERAQGATNE